VRQASGETTPATLQEHVTIGPTHSSTVEGSCWENAQPACKLNAIGGGMAVAHSGILTKTAALGGQLIPQESPASWPDRPRAASDTGVTAELLGRAADLSLEGAIVRQVAFTEPVVPAAIGRGGGLRRAWAAGSYPIPTPDTATATLRPFVTTQPPTLPLPNPEQEVAR
jgi:hypothetical protein